MAFKLVDELKKNGFNCDVQVHRSSVENLHYFIVCKTKDGKQIVDPNYQPFKEYLDPLPNQLDSKIFVGTLDELERLYGSKIVPTYQKSKQAPESDRPPCIDGVYPW